MDGVDLTGQHGGLLAGAFALGCAATWAFFEKIFTKIKDAEIVRLTKAMEDERRRCDSMESRLVNRIQTLEVFLLQMSPGHLRQEIQQALSEQRVTEDRERMEHRP